MSRTTSLNSSWNALPASVSESARVLRTSSVTASASSSALTCRLAMALLMPRKSAALV